MSLPELGPAAMRIVEWLGEVGGRWGLPAEACRVHGVLYLMARPVPAEWIASRLALDPASIGEALVWLEDERLAQHRPAGWITEADPWTLVMRTLETRRVRELALAREVLDVWRPGRNNTEDSLVARQAQRLTSLVDDIAAIDAGARRLSPTTVRRLVGIGGRASRLVDSALQGRKG